MTIGFRVVGAFTLVLVLLLAVGINAFVAIRLVASEARRVETGAYGLSAQADFNIQLRATVARARLYAATEDSNDLVALNGTIDALNVADAKLAERAVENGISQAMLHSQTKDYLRILDTIVGMIGARQKNSIDLRDALTASQVNAAAIEQRIDGDSTRRQAAVALLQGVGASGISSLRYRISRDPSDAEAAKRWAASVRKALHELVGSSVEGDPRLGKLYDALSASMTRYDAALSGVEEATKKIAMAAVEWEANAQHLLDSGIKLRLAGFDAQTGAAQRMLIVIGKAGVFDLIATALALASGAILALALVRTIARPLAAITEAMQGLAAGALETAIPSAARRDEVGAMAKAVKVFQDGLIKVGVLDAEKEAERLERRARTTAMEALNRSFEHEVGAHTASFAEAARAMTTSAKALLDTAARTSRKCGLVGAAAGEASSGVRHVAAGTQEVAISVDEVGRRVSTSARAASEAVTRAREADATVRDLQIGARRIGEIVGVIGAIAQETNLLALNATIEAARAGQAGRGFAVVAGEVKQLSVATSRATNEIGTYIKDVQSAMQTAASTLKDIGVSVHGMGENAVMIANAVEEQSAGVARITTNAGLAAAGAENVKLNIADVEADAVRTDEAARKVLAAAELVAGRAEAMRARVAVYLEQTRRA